MPKIPDGVPTPPREHFSSDEQHQGAIRFNEVLLDEVLTAYPFLKDQPDMLRGVMSLRALEFMMLYDAQHGVQERPHARYSQQQLKAIRENLDLVKNTEGWEARVERVLPYTDKIARAQGS